MKRRDFLRLLAASASAASLGGSVNAEERPPNIVLILVDDLGWRDVGCYGGALFETPNVDRLAEQGMRFTQAYANCPVCSPSRAAIMTGKNPARLGFTGHITATGAHRHPEGSRLLPPDDYLYLPHAEVSLAEALKPAGYVSASIGKWHLGHEGFWPEDQGFDVNIGGRTHGSPPDYFDPYENPEKDWNAAIPTIDSREPGEYLTDRLTDEAIGFMEAHQEQPFFLYLTHYGVHTPLQAPSALVEKYEKKFAGRDAGIHPVYAAMMENLDANAGRVLSALERLDLEENTVVIFASDNGGLSSSSDNAPLRQGKGWLYEGGIRTPLIIRWPGHIAPGAVSNEPNIGSDLYTTLMDVAGDETRPGEPLDGVSLRPLWEGKDVLERDALYWYYPHYHGEAQSPGAAIRKGDYKLIEFYDPQRIELYNLAKDLSESYNLASELPKKVDELLKDLRGYLDEVDAKPPTLNPAFKDE